jgi:hypothetical protein
MLLGQFNIFCNRSQRQLQWTALHKHVMNMSPTGKRGSAEGLFVIRVSW